MLPSDATLRWLLAGDIAIQYQTRRDLLGENLQAPYPGQVHFEMEKAGRPSRWNTLRALRVLRWLGASK